MDMEEKDLEERADRKEEESREKAKEDMDREEKAKEEYTTSIYGGAQQEEEAIGADMDREVMVGMRVR